MLELKGKYCKDCKIFTDNIEQEALSMVYRFLDNPMFEGAKIRIMPDVHAGKDIVVGFTVPFTDHVNPDHVGGDIGCSVSTAITDMPINAEDYPMIEKMIRESVKFGMSIQQKPVYPVADLYKHLQLRLQQARQQWPEMVGAMDVSEKGITALLKRIDQKEHMFYNSIGTVGGGNHFVEVGVTPEGNYAFTVHCGSRNLGQKVWKYWKMEAGKLTGVTNGFLVEDAMKGYITDMVVAQAYAEFNHQIIDRLVLEAICEGSGRQAHIVEQIYTTHNYIDFSMKMMRKGAVAAPAGRKLVIPFNMRDGLIIARGKGNEDWNQSAPHGAGRLLSRSDAKELIDLEEFRESMKGIYSTSVGTGTIDESPMAYKDPKEILRLIEDTVEVEYFIRPVINLKATNSYDSSVEIDVNEEQD
ncbi:MAG: RtcB family protein [Bacteroidaceae bacterium]|nr:RtcB family protein [Bacteroidaceae bacterium]